VCQCFSGHRCKDYKDRRRLSKHRAYRNFANKTFANVTCGLAKSLSTSLVMETNKMHPHTQVPRMQPTFIFVCDNSKEYVALSLIYPLDFRQLANVHCTFANKFLDFRYWRMPSWRKSYWRNSGILNIGVGGHCNTD
jgi:hypothetical protein